MLNYTEHNRQREREKEKETRFTALHSGYISTNHESFQTLIATTGIHNNVNELTSHSVTSSCSRYCSGNKRRNTFTSIIK